MPRKLGFDLDELYSILLKKKSQIYNEETQKISSPADKVWKQLENDMDHRITGKYIYTIVLENRHGVHDKLNIVSVNCDSENTQGEQNPSISNESFQIVLSKDEWNSIYSPEPCTYNRKWTASKNGVRKYFILTPFLWTNVIQEHFYRILKNSCCIVFKRAKIYEKGSNFLSIKGQCKACSSYFTATMKKKPETTASDVTLECTYRGSFHACNQKLKRIILGSQKNDFINKMNGLKWSASYTHKHEANSLMDYGDPPPSHLPTMNALRVLKHREMKKLQVNEDPIISLLILKMDEPFKSVLSYLSSDPFVLHYWSPAEINTYRMYTKECKIPQISIDATGSVVKPITLLSDRKTHHIFLYQIAVIDQQIREQFAVAHMLSECHNNVTISHWLSKWLRSNIKPPKIVVSDFSLAIMMASVRSFTQYSTLSQYIMACSSVLTKNSISDLPVCMIRNDFNHLMKQFSSWKEIKKEKDKPRFKRFYLHSLALIVSTEDYDDVKKLIEHFFTVALNSTEGIDRVTGLDTPCEIAKTTLKRQIGYDNEDLNEDFADESDVDGDLLGIDEIDPEETENPEVTHFYTEINNIYKRCLDTSNLIKGDHDNFHYAPELAKRLHEFCKYLPIWGAVMNTAFGFGSKTISSAASESLFKEVKHDIFHHVDLPARLDTFMFTHIDFLMGRNKLLYDSYSHKPTNTTSQFSKSNKKVDDLTSDVSQNPVVEQAKENWKGLGENKSRTKNSYYLKKNPTLLHYKENKSKSPVIGILKNGNFLSLQPITIENVGYSFQNTCAFDSIVHAWCVLFCDSEKYAEFVNGNQSLLLFALIKNMVQSGVGEQTYRMRGQILQKIYDEKTRKEKNGEKLIDDDNKKEKKIIKKRKTETLKKTQVSNSISDKLQVIDCTCTVLFIAEALFSQHPSMTELRHCPKCQKDVVRKLPVLTVNLSSADISGLESAVMNCAVEKRSKCNFCKKTLTPSVTFGNHLIIEPWIISRKVEDGQTSFAFKLEDVPKFLMINPKNVRFILRGVIAYFGIETQSKYNNSTGHYVSYVWREQSNCWEEYDDTKVKSLQISDVNSSISVVGHAIIYSQ